MTQGNLVDFSTAVSDAVVTPRQRGLERSEALRALIGGRSVIYAFRLKDGIIKIGCTRNLVKRRACYPGSEILGFQSGDRDDEQAIHASLRSHRARGHEYYRPAQAVLDVVNGMRADFGLPRLEA